MAFSAFKPGSLALYKIHPAIVRGLGEKIEIELPDGKSKRVRDKDIELLHPGPVASLGPLVTGLETENAAIDEAWELLEGEEVTLSDLAELLYGDYSPATAWGTWKVLRDGLFFEGTTARIVRRSTEAIAADRQARAEKQQAEQAQAAFLQRLKSARLEDDDRRRLAEVERVALGTSQQSRILAHFDVAATPDAAHRFLVRCGYWTAEHNPWPARAGVQLEPLEIGAPALPDEPRRDLTGLRAWAIDDAGNQDPDDAVSVDGDRIWVHIADVAALVRPGGHLDRAARERAANLYLPEQTCTMLPQQITDQLGLGLAETSPALSVGFRFDGATLSDIEVTPSWIRATRISYEDAEQRLDEPDLATLRRRTDAYRALRTARGAARIDLPEVSVRVVDDEVRIRPLARLASRELVMDAMLMAGEAVARFAVAHQVAIPYAMQPAPDQVQDPQGIAANWAYRRLFKPSRVTVEPEPHFGLGLDCYTRATSPLRRYADLVVHQQIRASVTGAQPLALAELETRLAGLGAAGAAIRRAERQSNLHWKLVYLARHPGWRGAAVVADVEERKTTVIVPELALETRMRAIPGAVPDQQLLLELSKVDLADQVPAFRVVEQHG